MQVYIYIYYVNHYTTYINFFSVHEFRLIYVLFINDFLSKQYVHC